MSVGEIVRTKGTDVLTTLPEVSIVDVARLMADHRIGLVVVCSEGGRVMGVISERDIVYAVAANSHSMAALTVEDLYTREIKTCLPSDDTREIMRLMHEGRFRHMPVVEHGNLKGLISIGDIMEYLKEQSELHSNSEVWEELNFL